MVRNSVEYVSCKDRKAAAADLKDIYLAPSADAASGPPESHRTYGPQSVYTTDAIESVNYTLQRSLKTR
jgi:transposase-like protein